MGACRAHEGGGATVGGCARTRGAAGAPGHPAQSPLPSVQRYAGDRRHQEAVDRPRRPGQESAGRGAARRSRAEGPMSYEWGRAPEAGKWQRALPVWLMSVIVIAVASGIAVWLVRQTFVWTPLQRF